MEESYIHVNSQDKIDVICTTLNEAGGTGLSKTFETEMGPL